MECGFCFLGCRMASGKGSGSWGKPEGICGFCGLPVLKRSELTCPNPSIVFEGFRNLPVSRTPHLLGSPGSPRRGEQIPQASVILRLIPGNVHRDSLKPSE